MKSKPAKKTAKTAPQDAPKKVFDVSRPGKTPVSPTSRPVIVGHKPQVKDPMMSDRDERPLLDSNKKVTIQPSAPAVAAPSSDANTASSALASHQSETVAASQSGSDRNEAAPTSPATRAAEADQSPARDLPQATPPESGMISGSTGEEAPSAPEVPDAEKPAESSTADSVATIATSSVVDDVPPPQEDTAEPSKPVDPVIAGTKNSGLIFDDLDGSDTPDLTKPSPVTSDTTDAPVPAATDADSEPAMSGQAVVSHHKQSSGAATVLITLFILVLVAGIVVDILLDMGILNVSNIPHTNFFPPN